MPHVSFDTKFDSDPLSQQCTPSWESGRKGLADQPGPGVFPGGLFSSGLALLQQVLLHLAHGHLCPFHGRLQRHLEHEVPAGCWGAGWWQWEWWLPPSSSQPSRGVT